jgi:hypothetical protein
VLYFTVVENTVGGHSLEAEAEAFSPAMLATTFGVGLFVNAVLGVTLGTFEAGFFVTVVSPAPLAFCATRAIWNSFFVVLLRLS